MQYPSGWVREKKSHATVRLRYMAWWYQGYHLVVIYYSGTPSDAMGTGLSWIDWIVLSFDGDLETE